LFRIKKEARRCKKDFEKIRFKMMFKTTPDSMDALKTCQGNPILAGSAGLSSLCPHPSSPECRVWILFRPIKMMLFIINNNYFLMNGFD